jgi:hypothetical protein
MREIDEKWIIKSELELLTILSGIDVDKIMYQE